MTVICEKASSNTLRQHNNKRRLGMIGVSYLRHLKSERCSKVGVAYYAICFKVIETFYSIKP